MIDLAQQVFYYLAVTPEIQRTAKNIAMHNKLRRKQVKAILHTLQMTGYVECTLRSPQCVKKRPIYKPAEQN